MSQNDRSTEMATAAAKAVGVFGPKRRRLTWRALMLVGLALAGIGGFVAWRLTPVDPDDGFITFQPDVSQFPPAPVADAQTLAGIGQPDAWPSETDLCPYSTGGLRSSAFGLGWNTVRHDWQENGEARAWIVSERTIGFDDLGAFDDYVESFYNLTKYCGWQYDQVNYGYNSILTELDGLPGNSFAFTIGVAPNGSVADGFEGSNPADFRALGAFVPGPKRGQLMNVIWVGWGADVPRDDFVAAVNSMYTAARNNPKPDYSSGDTRIDFTSEGAVLDEEAISTIIGGDPSREYVGRLGANNCDWSAPAPGAWGDVDDDQYGFVTEADNVSIRVGRWHQRSSYLEAKDLSVGRGAPLCVGGFQTPTVLIEPISVAGLPDGTVVARVNGAYGGYGATVTDDDKQLMVVVTWGTDSGEVPEDKFVEVVNQVWDQIQADNP